MFRNRRLRPSRPEAGFTLVEVLVAAAIVMIVLIAAADLLANLTVRTAKIQEAEQARAVAYQVSERAKALGCGAVYASDVDLGVRAEACRVGLQANGLAAGVCTQPSGLGDTQFCWSDGNRTYQVEMQTGWDYSTTPPPLSPLPPPDVFVRRFTVTKVGESTKLVDGLEFREAAPDRVGQGEPLSNCSNGLTVGSNTIKHSIPSSGSVLYPYPGAPTCT
jgi:type II secretory pathway pseudopilin PulG